MEQRHIIYDWNGTLLDDLDICLACTNHLRQSQGLDPFPDLDAYRQSFFFPVPEWYREMGFDMNKFPELARQYMDEYVETSKACRLHPDVKAVLQAGKEKGLKQTILSASRQDILEQQTGAFGLQELADDICGSNNIHAAGKEALARQYVSAHPDDQFVFIGDSVHDWEVAQACKAGCILVDTGHQAREKLEATGAPVADSLEQAMEMLDA